MTAERWIRVLAGSLVLAGLALAHWHCEWWLLLPAFVALNLIQSAFTGFCPPEMLLRRLGVPSCRAGSGQNKPSATSDGRPGST